MSTAASKEQIVDLGAEAYLDPVLFCKVFLTHWFSKPVPWVHRGVLAILLHKTDFLLKYGELDKIFRHFVYKVQPTDPESPELPIFSLREDGTISMALGQYTLIKMPRSFAKTTLINSAVIYLICYKEKMFPVLLSESGSHAEDQLKNIKGEFESNVVIRESFGNLVPDRQSSDRWTAKRIELTNGVCVSAIGRGGQVRGSLLKGHRPDFIVVDDVEDEESVNTPEQRKKTQKWFYEAVIPAQDRIRGNATIVVAGTLLHSEALLQVLEQDPEWTTIVFGAIDRDGAPLWADNMSLKKLQRAKLSFQLVGNLAGYYREYFNQISGTEEAIFRQDMIRYIPPGEPLPKLVATALTLDPAISDRIGADYAAFAVNGITERGEHVLLDIYAAIGMTMRQQCDKYFELHALWNPNRHGIEAISFQRALIHLMQEEMYAKGMYFEIIPITHGNIAKVERVQGVLQPRYAARRVLHARKFPLYEQQLLDWPSGKKDLADAFSMGITLLDPYAPLAAPDDSLTHDEYEPLIEVFHGQNWRTAP